MTPEQQLMLAQVQERHERDSATLNFNTVSFAYDDRRFLLSLVSDLQAEVERLKGRWVPWKPGDALPTALEDTWRMSEQAMRDARLPKEPT